VTFGPYLGLGEDATFAPMTVFVIRHAYAGERASWIGESDLERPLDSVGRDQAHEIARSIAERRVVRLVSSPARRCVETLEPLAAAVGLTVGIDDRLLEGTDPRDLLRVLNEVPDGSVLCVHGAELATLLDALGLTDDRCLAKAVIWTLERDFRGLVVATNSHPCTVPEPVSAG
jgi:phosphohistidine phosphatase SixA